jgi:hypothetical protein
MRWQGEFAVFAVVLSTYYFGKLQVNAFVGRAKLNALLLRSSAAFTCPSPYVMLGIALSWTPTCAHRRQGQGGIYRNGAGNQVD